MEGESEDTSVESPVPRRQFPPYPVQDPDGDGTPGAGSGVAGAYEPWIGGAAGREAAAGGAGREAGWMVS
ncbi:hypothetical protein GCM10023324_34540 [Streptomyces youssoufiensis]